MFSQIHFHVYIRFLKCIRHVPRLRQEQHTSLQNIKIKHMQWLSQSKSCTPGRNFSGALKMLYTLTYFFDTFSSAISAILLRSSHHRSCGHGSSSRHVVLGASYSKSTWLTVVLDHQFQIKGRKRTVLNSNRD